MVKLSNISLYFGLIYILLCGSQANKDLHIITKIYHKTYKMECNLNPEYVQNVTCDVKAKSWTRAIMNFRGDLKIPLRNVSIDVGFYKLYSQFRPYLFNFSMNACNFLKSKSGTIYARAIYKILRPISNLNHSCPYDGTIIAEGMELKEAHLPIGFIAPLGKFKTSLKFSEGSREGSTDLGDVNVYSEVFEKRIRMRD